MQLLIITSIREYEKHIPVLFKKAGITAFSSTNIKGYNTLETENPMDNWFSSMDENLESSIFFTFTTAELIDAMLEQIKTFNIKIEGQNPMHAIVLGIEKFV
ncbi:MAG: hypothetical protein Q8J84_06280 [Flavobacteriaceae bacterium]|nr:hypothetical protein [Flavobacteriaceae bacterium]